jgi:O-antigen ligase
VRRLAPFAVAAVALLVGVLAATAPRWAIELAIGLPLLGLLLRAPRAILGLLLASLFLEILSIGGLTISRVLAPLALCVTATAWARDESAGIRGALAWAIGAYSGWALASGFWTVNGSGTVYLLGSLAIALMYMAAFSTLVRTITHLYRALVALSLIALPVSLYAIYTFFAGSALRSSAGKGDPNSFAAYELIVLPLVAAVLAETPNRRLRMTLGATAVAIIGAVMTSLSRGGLVTLGVLVLLVVIAPARVVFHTSAQKVGAIALLGASAALFFAATGPAFSTRINETFTTGGETGSGRLDMWKGAVHSFHDHPVLGIGYGTFSSVSTSLLQNTPGVDLVDYTPSPEGDLAHNAYLETLAELGIPGLVFFVAILAATAQLLLSSARRARAAGARLLERTCHSLLFSLAAWCVSAVFLSLETSRPLWIIIGLAFATSRLAAGREPGLAEGRGLT